MAEARRRGIRRVIVKTWLQSDEDRLPEQERTMQQVGKDFRFEARLGGYEVYERRRRAELEKLCVVFQRDFANLVASQLPCGSARRGTGFAKKTIQSSWGHDPQKQKFMIGVFKSMPRVLRNVKKRTLVHGMADAVKMKSAASIQNQERLFHFGVTMHRNARSRHNLLGSNSEIW